MTDSQEKIEISAENLCFSGDFSFVVNQPGSILLAKSKSSNESYRRNEPFCPLTKFAIKQLIYLRRRRITMLNPRL
ncbi:MAG: hypothetical protein RBT25_10945 [Lentisphaeria bacterium]|nr:hypothetical protein [Lentisphaeria bacterium]